ncbi:hypothetical protein Skr01_07160 [Sphaerisporangium krabiense]|nr:hypothetical protein Skr01_07160 [Sphaerisporangium krabiense]
MRVPGVPIFPVASRKSGTAVTNGSTPSASQQISRMPIPIFPGMRRPGVTVVVKGSRASDRSMSPAWMRRLGADLQQACWPGTT